jgi:hypothetical protein
MRRGTILLLALLPIVVLCATPFVLRWLEPPPGPPRVWPPIGSTGHVHGRPLARLFIDESDLRFWEDATTRNDLKQMMVAEDQGRLVFPESTTVRVLDVKGTAVQVEILDGPLTGKRGWSLASAFAPDL